MRPGAPRLGPVLVRLGATDLEAVAGSPAHPSAEAGESAECSLDALVDRYRGRLGEVATGGHSELGRQALAELVERWLVADRVVGADEAPDVAADIASDMVGLGPLENLLDDERITEIMVSGTEPVRVEVAGVLHETTARFRDADHLRVVIDRLLAGSGRRLDDGAPMVDARLEDGTRLNAVLPPVALEGPHLTLRRPRPRPIDMTDLIDGGAVDGRLAAFLEAAIVGRRAVLVTGAAGAGKTTILGALVALVPHGERVLVLEDTAELRTDHPHIARMECRPAGRDGRGEVTLRDLVRNSLRMRPDRIVVGEVRGAEAGDMVQAMNTGHEGSMATLHANGAGDALLRLEAMLAMAWPALGERLPRRWVAAAVDLVVHCERSSAGDRRVTEVAAVEADADGLPRTLPLFTRDVADGELGACGEVPRRCLERMARCGVVFPPSRFAGRLQP